MVVFKDIKIEAKLKKQVIEVEIQRIRQDISRFGFDIELCNLDLWINALKDLIEQLEIIKKENENED